MSGNISSIEANLDCQDSATGTFRYRGSREHFSANKAKFITYLKQQAQDRKLTQSRICFHENDDSMLQVMFVYHSTGHKARMHVHPDKDEYLHIIEGSLSIRIYGKDDKVIETFTLSSRPVQQNQDLFCFVPRCVVHDVVIQEDSFFLETTTGPFHKSSTILIDDLKSAKYMPKNSMGN